MNPRINPKEILLTIAAIEIYTRKVPARDCRYKSSGP